MEDLVLISAKYITKNGLRYATSALIEISSTTEVQTNILNCPSQITDRIQFAWKNKTTQRLEHNYQHSHLWPTIYRVALPTARA